MARNVFGETTPCKVAKATPVRWARVVLEVLAEACGAGGAGGAACGFGRPSVFCCLRGGFGGASPPPLPPRPRPPPPQRFYKLVLHGSVVISDRWAMSCSTSSRHDTMVPVC